MVKVTKEWIRQNVASARGFGGYFDLSDILKSEKTEFETNLTEEGVDRVESLKYRDSFKVLVEGKDWFDAYPY